MSAWEALRESYWFVPMLMALAAAALALGIIEIDRTVSEKWAQRLPWVADAGPEGTRAVLSAIAGSMITVTGVVFSITIVALTLASSQFGPRLLRNFLRDRGNQLVLGTFVATFLYSLLVLRAVGEDGRVPHLATAGAVAMAMGSLFVLIYFVHHSASSIQASSIIASVAGEIDAQIPNLFPDELGDEATEPSADAHEVELQGLERDGVEIASESQGYVQFVDLDAVLDLAIHHDLLILLRRRPGDFVAAGSSLARVGPADRASEESRSALRDCFVVGARRTAVQDLGFLVDQLTEMAVRALSPGVNDPQTAVACIHRLGALIERLGERAMPAAFRYDDRGRLRVLASPTSFEGIVGACLDPIRRYGAGRPEIVAAAFEMLEEAGSGCPHADRRRALVEQAVEFHQAFLATKDPLSRRDLERVEHRFGRLMAHFEPQGRVDRGDPPRDTGAG